MDEETVERILLAMIMLFHEMGVKGDDVQTAFFTAMHSSPYSGEGF